VVMGWSTVILDVCLLWVREENYLAATTVNLIFPLQRSNAYAAPHFSKLAATKSHHRITAGRPAYPLPQVTCCDRLVLRGFVTLQGH
jgi:hypothetical protein